MKSPEVATPGGAKIRKGSTKEKSKELSLRYYVSPRPNGPGRVPAPALVLAVQLYEVFAADLYSAETKLVHIS